MAETTIEWADYTFNPWMGCSKVSPACKFCYAERDFDHRYKRVQWGPNGTRVITSQANWSKPLKWNREHGSLRVAWSEDCAERDSLTWPNRPIRPRVFCASLADVFEDWKGPVVDHHGAEMLCGPEDRKMTMDDVRQQLFELIDSTPHLDWLLLTKRPENILRMWGVRGEHGAPVFRSNVWIGTSVEDQEQAEKRIPELLSCRHLSPVLFLSCEPLLSEVDLTDVTLQSIGHRTNCLNGKWWSSAIGKWTDEERGPTVDWVIAGGESGPDARPSHPDWFRSLRDQCTATGVPFLFKQWGEWSDGSDRYAPNACILNNGDIAFPDTARNRNACNRRNGGRWNEMRPVAIARVGKKKAGRLLDGMEHNGFPEVAV